MRAVIQRVSEAKVEIDQQINGEINQGFVVLLGIVDGDGQDEIDWLIRKILGMRIFSDGAGKMNLSISDVNGELLIVSQFTLHASTKKGNRPSFTKAAKPDIALPRYQSFIKSAAIAMGKPCATGEFGADMKVSLTNDGPVTIIIDTELKE